MMPAVYAPRGYGLRRLRDDEEGAAKAGGSYLVEVLYVTFGDGRKRHDACIVDDDIDLVENLESLLCVTTYCALAEEASRIQRALPCLEADSGAKLEGARATRAEHLSYPALGLSKSGS